MQFNPYLNFDGNCAEAFAFYKDLFKGTVVHQSTFGEIPPDPQNPPIPPEAKDRLMHVHLQVGAQALMGSDTLPAHTSLAAMPNRKACGCRSRRTMSPKAGACLTPWRKAAR